MKKSKVRNNESSVKKTSAPRPPRKRKKIQTGDKVEKLFGVHIISDADIENHFGASEEKPDGESENKKRK
jgi:hypothetical protein